MNASQGVAQAAASAAAHAQAHRLSQAHSCRSGGARIGVERVPGQGFSPDDPDPASGTPGLACRVVPAEPRAASGASSKSNGHGAGSAGSSRSRAQGGVSGGQEGPAGGKQSMPRVRGGKSIDEESGAQPQPGCPPCSSSSASAAPGTTRGAPAKMQIIAEDAAQCAPVKKHEAADEAEADKAQQGSGAGGVRAGEQGGKGSTPGRAGRWPDTFQ